MRPDAQLEWLFEISDFGGIGTNIWCDNVIPNKLTRGEQVFIWKDMMRAFPVAIAETMTTKIISAANILPSCRLWRLNCVGEQHTDTEA